MNHRLAGVVVLALTLLPAIAMAGALDSLSQGASRLMQSSDSGKALSEGSLLQKLGGGSFQLGSAQNVAGILGYCQKHGYAPSAAETVKNQLMNKLGMQPATDTNDDYKQGLSGILKDAEGGNFNLSTLKETVGKRVCSAIADKAASTLLGG